MTEILFARVDDVDASAALAATAAAQAAQAAAEVAQAAAEAAAASIGTPKNSLEIDAGELQLVGDEATPDVDQYYGTDGAGVRGYHDLPAGGGGGAVDSVFTRTGDVVAEVGDYAAFYQPIDAQLDYWATLAPSANVQTVLGAADFAAIRTALGLVIGTNVQAWDAQLDTWATVSPSANGQSLVASATYATMRGLLDLEAGTDFYSIAAANAAFAAAVHTHVLADITDAGDLAALDLVTVSDIDATGTPDGTTFLRGDGAWAAPPGAGGGIDNVVEDLTPQLGGDLDLNTFDILGMIIGADIQAWDAQLDSLSAATANGVSLVTAANYAAMRALLDLEAGTDFYSVAAADALLATKQGLDADLTSWAAVVRAAGFDTFVATPSSANLLALITNETGTGALVFGTTPTLATPVLNGIPTGTGIGIGNDLLLTAKNTPNSGEFTRFTAAGIEGLTEAEFKAAANLEASTDYYAPGGTDVPVTDGGTGSSTAAGAATNLGLGTGDSPQHAGVNLGHASDTTLSRLAAGVLGVEGKTIPYVLGQSGVQVGHTGNTSETTLATVTVPAGAMGANGRLIIWTSWVVSPNDASAKSARVRFGGTEFQNVAMASNIGLFRPLFIMNVNSASSQKASFAVGNAFGVGLAGFAAPTGAVDTSVAQDLTITGQLADGTDSISLESYFVEVAYGA